MNYTAKSVILPLDENKFTAKITDFAQGTPIFILRMAFARSIHGPLVVIVLCSKILRPKARKRD